jgi:hypothetical protein
MCNVENLSKCEGLLADGFGDVPHTRLQMTEYGH